MTTSTRTISPQDRRRLQVMQRCRQDFEYFSANFLRIVTKDRDFKPFVWNKAQKYVHKKIEEQRRATGGMVRALILKGRQQGISTYVAARYYHRSSLFKYTAVYILAHMQQASDNLFKMVARYHDSNVLQPHVGKRNQTQMEFDRLDSSYTVATAGEGKGGRSMTSSLFHGSEVAFWASAEEHFSASIQTIPDKDGTEIILESTANGPTGKFYELWQEAEAGRGDYIAIFVPWFWQDEYSRPVPKDFELQDDGDEDNLSEKDYYDAFKGDGMTMGHMVWRRAKVSSMGRDKFNQEYPATAQMAFVNTHKNNYIPTIDVIRARKREIEGYGPLILGVDPSGEGGDRFAIAGRRGPECEFVTWRDNLNTLEATYWLIDVYKKYKPARMFIDSGGLGSAIVTNLKAVEDIPSGVIVGVNFGSTSQFKMARRNATHRRADEKPGPINRRAEMYERMKNWLQLEEGVSIPDMDILQGDLTATPIKARLDNDLQLMSKPDMRREGIRSPDTADALALTFASLQRITKYYDKPTAGGRHAEVDEEFMRRGNVASGRSRNGWMA